MSREHDRLQQLKKALAAYRMVFGQPHQDDLVTWLGSCYTEDELTTLTDQLRIDLAPRPETTGWGFRPVSELRSRPGSDRS